MYNTIPWKENGLLRLFVWSDVKIMIMVFELLIRDVKFRALAGTLC